MGGIFDRLRNKEKNPDHLKPLEDFFEESKKELEKLRQKPRVRKKVIVVSYNITHILVAGVVCLFLLLILAVYYFSSGYALNEVSIVSGAEVKKTEVKSSETERVEKLRKLIRKE